MCTKGEHLVDRYCCWLRIVSTRAQANAGASTGANYLLFQQVTNTADCQEDRLALNLEFVSILSQEAGDMGKQLWPMSSLLGQGPWQCEEGC